MKGLDKNWERVITAVNASVDSGPSWWRKFCAETLRPLVESRIRLADDYATLLAERDALRKAMEAVDELWTLDAINYADEMSMDSPVGKVWTLVRAALAPEHQREEAK